MRPAGPVRMIVGMTTSHRMSDTDRRRIALPARRRRMFAPVLALAIGVGGTTALSGVITSPGPARGDSRQDGLAIPGVRGTGGGARYDGVSTSPGRLALAIPRKAGGSSLEYL